MGSYECNIFVDVTEHNPNPDNPIDFKVFPNPTQGILYFAFRISQYQYVTLTIYDVNGREVAVILDEKIPAGEHMITHDLSGLPAGVYFYRLTTENCGLPTANCRLAGNW